MRRWLLTLGIVAAAGCSCSKGPSGFASGGGAAGSGGSGGTAARGGSGAVSGDAAPPDASADVGIDVERLDASGLEGSTDPAYAWLFQPDAWTLLTTAPPCDLRQADLDKVAWPGHQWQSCGTGCRAAAVVEGPLHSGAFRFGSGARVESSGIHVFLSAAVRFQPTGVAIAESFNLSTGEPSALISNFNPDCQMGFNSTTSSRGLAVIQTVPVVSDVYAFAPVQRGDPVVWASPAVRDSFVHFDFTGGWGAIRSQTAVVISRDFSSSVMETVFSSPAYQLGPVAQGDAVLWTDWSGPLAVVRAWTAAGGARPLISGPWNTSGVALSPERIVWIGTTGIEALHGMYDTAQLFWSERQLDPDQVTVQAGPTLPVTISVSTGFFTHGKWAALRHIADDSEPAGILLIDLDSSEVWEIPEPEGHHLTVMTVSDSELLLADSESIGQAGQYFNWMRRYDLAQLSSYAVRRP